VIDRSPLPEDSILALEPGKKAPDIRLPDARNGAERHIAFETLTLLAFFKHNCPVCQMAAPYVEKFQAYAGPGFQVVTVLEDAPEPARAFAETFGLTSPVVLDEAPYKVSNVYRLTNVPTLFLVEPGGRIAETLVNWNKQGYNDLSATVARRLGEPANEVSPPDDGTPVFRPG
jgi:peroxiredoxin